METDVAPQVTNRKWYEIWWDVWRHPGTDVFRRLLQEPGADYNRGFKWVALMAVIFAVLNSLISGIFPQRIASAASSGMITSLVCGVIVAPIVAVIAITIMAGIYHWIAKLFGGNGEWGQLVFCFSVVLAPSYLLTALFRPLYRTDLGSLFSQGTSALAQQMSSLFFCLVLPSLALSIYSVVLNICAIKAVENIDTGRSILTYFIPVIVAILLAACVSVLLVFPALNATR